MQQAERIRARVLAAAEQCLLEGGFGDARLHSTIARRAGLSRPTVYKYVGDQDAINAALIQRELGVFLERLQPIMDRPLPFADHLVTVMVFVVGHAREHRLLQAALRDAPQLLLPWFTTRAGVLIEQVELVASATLRRYIDDGELPDIEPRILIDAMCRIALSLVFTNGVVELSDPDALRAYLGSFLHPVGVVRR